MRNKTAALCSQPRADYNLCFAFISYNNNDLHKCINRLKRLIQYQYIEKEIDDRKKHYQYIFKILYNDCTNN